MIGDPGSQTYAGAIVLDEFPPLPLSPYFRIRPWPSVLGMAICAAGCARREDPEPKPAPPVVDDVLAEFDDPTLEVDEDVLSELVPVLEEAFRLLEDLDVETEVLDPIFEAIEENEERGTSSRLQYSVLSPSNGPVRAKSQALVTEGDGFLRVTRICDGWEDPVVDEEKNGKTVTIVGFTDAGLDPVLWTDVFACRYKTGSGNILLDAGAQTRGAEVILALGKPIPFDELAETKIVFILDFKATIAEVGDQNVSLAFRSKPGDSFVEFLIHVDDESVVLFSDGSSLLGFRSRNGIYSCSTEEAQCTDAAGNSIPLPF